MAGAGSAELGTPGVAESPAIEALACVTCRARKLKCDRIKPICTRCSKQNVECVYPESRRKPAFKRRNVRELEARLAQVEDLLKETSNSSTAQATGDELDGLDDFLDTAPEEGIVPSYDFATAIPNINPSGHAQFPDNGSFDHSFSWTGVPQTQSDDAGPAGSLLGLGMFEAPPPMDIVEELHRVFFSVQQSFIPIVHPGRYLQAFYSAPHMRPPMALQYAIWSMASNGHDKYSMYHDIFYRRCRHYLQEDELRGEGEHFITVAHAQSWALIATDEARCLWFTRASMSSARCLRLVNMMGLHRLDSPFEGGESAPTIAPPRDWTDLEERRRLFWGAFCIDSHGSISTGWPSLIDIEKVSTHLPASEEAFEQCREEETCVLADVFAGSTYSTFAGSAIICHVFNRILDQVHRPKPDDQPDEPEFGKFWKRHRELDNTLSSLFMFLPERLLLPKNIRSPVAVHTNLNMHASVICLHNAACEKVEEYNLSPSIKKVSQDRMFTAAQEIINVIKLTSHMSTEYRSPLVALSLYCAASVYTTYAHEGNVDSNTSNLEFLLKAMEAIGKTHVITRAFFHQAILDIRQKDSMIPISLPSFAHLFGQDLPAPCGHNIPLFARSKISKHTGIQPPLPGRLPLGNPIGSPFQKAPTWGSKRVECPMSPFIGGKESTAGNKRKRVSPASMLRPPNQWFKSAPDPLAFPTESLVQGTSNPTAMQFDGGFGNPGPVKLPHRGGSNASTPSASRETASTQAGSSSSTATPGTSSSGTGVSAGDGPGLTSLDPLTHVSAADFLEELDSWDLSNHGAIYAQISEAFGAGNFDVPQTGYSVGGSNDGGSGSGNRGGEIG